MLTSLAQDERRLMKVSAAILGAMIVAVTFARPGHRGILPPCPFHALTGFFCPGCGSTRALYLLVHGHPLAAFGENALAVTLLPFLIYELLAVLSRRLPVISTRLRPWAVWTLFAVVLAFSILRNIPGAPFNLLAPTDLR
ncbi:conserved hypothetical protein [Candidatus Koribacter versatilis Ellin345]|uniref:DUF2752 domain-containing protein n=1 Tax=Koribacter versatilis (strain Ellin345) TaxID=204669 RepID=Q1IQG4_KORVE|nr:DUF2752 domain-containing protein [Candidatus Koribacter versatilis]ABF40886.1 conserved hypothetical protein [Candidatus Koribacter versatilis Ellin345]